MLPKPAKGESRWAVVLPPLLLGVVLIAIWYAVTYLVLDEQRRFLLPAPHKVISEGFFGEDRRGDSTMSIILGGLRRSAIVAAMGLSVSIVIGFTTAVIMSQSAKAERAIFPYMVMLQATPILALVPLIGFWFGYSTMPRVIVCVIISLFPIIVNTLFGLQSADQGMHDLFTLQHAEPDDAAAHLDVPGGDAGDLRRPADLGRPGGDRRHRRRLLLRPGHARSGSGAQAGHRQQRERVADRHRDRRLSARRGRVLVLRLDESPGHEPVALDDRRQGDRAHRPLERQR